MNRQDLTKILAKKSALTHKKANEIVGNLLTIIADSLYCGERIQLAKFGTFWVKFYPSTNNFLENRSKSSASSARFIPKFRCSRVLKRRFLLS